MISGQCLSESEHIVNSSELVPACKQFGRMANDDSLELLLKAGTPSDKSKIHGAMACAMALKEEFDKENQILTINKLPI